MSSTSVLQLLLVAFGVCVHAQFPMGLQQSPNTFPISALGSPFGPLNAGALAQQPSMSMLGQGGFGGNTFQLNQMQRYPTNFGNGGGRYFGDSANNQAFQNLQQLQSQAFRGYQQHPRALGQQNYLPQQLQVSPGPAQVREIPNARAPSLPTSSLPKFLEDAPEDVVADFKQIIRQPNTTYENKITQVEALVTRLDDAHQLLYNQFMAESDRSERSKQDTIHQTVANMSSAAQEKFAKISAILRNPALPEEERWNRVLTIYNDLEPSLQKEFDEKFKPLV